MIQVSSNYMLSPDLLMHPTSFPIPSAFELREKNHEKSALKVMAQLTDLTQYYRDQPITGQLEFRGFGQPERFVDVSFGQASPQGPLELSIGNDRYGMHDKKVQKTTDGTRVPIVLEDVGMLYAAHYRVDQIVEGLREQRAKDECQGIGQTLVNRFRTDGARLTNGHAEVFGKADLTQYGVYIPAEFGEIIESGKLLFGMMVRENLGRGYKETIFQIDGNVTGSWRRNGETQIGDTQVAKVVTYRNFAGEKSYYNPLTDRDIVDIQRISLSLQPELLKP